MIGRSVAGMLAAALLLVAPALAQEAQRTYVLVVKDTVNPYMQTVYQGFVDACAELGVQPLLAGAEDADPGAQARIIDALVDQGVTAIAVAANDEAGVTAPLQSALAAGIKVVSVDSAADVSCRLTHIQQADPQVLARALLQAAHRMIAGEGELAILSTTETMPNQATWVGLMMKEYRDHPQLYENMRIVEIAYGNDDAQKSREETQRLLNTYPDLKVLIAPTTVGIAAAADVLEQNRSKVLITGLGLPSAMEPYIQSGTCPWMYLWNPIDTGYLAAYALFALEQGQITGAVDETFSAGRFGEKIVTPALDGGTEVVVGNPYKFDANNILSWKDVF